ncbi:helix-turn-helix domain-containing protein [Asaia bogorensis]|uniref:helix-turn-helix domain-containing protein n=1 Tax=Asaia bogorensis TaxID=91915 RepID=UPI000EFB4E96|nr:helix-turn-helix domain-containing protein [Asaia bogorensis]
MAQKPCGMHAEDIRAAIRKKYGTMAALSRKLGKHQNTVATVISQPGHSIVLEQRICEELGLKPEIAFPDRYHADGTPVSTRMARTNTALRATDLRRNGAAA